MRWTTESVMSSLLASLPINCRNEKSSVGLGFLPIMCHLHPLYSLPKRDRVMPISSDRGHNHPT